MRKHNFPAILLAAMVTCTVFTGCGKTESNEAVAQQMETETETETETALESEETESVEETSEESEETATEETFSNDIADYTFTDMDKTMYAKGTIKLRSLPSAAGDKLDDKLSENQEVTVTGQRNETGWYRIAYNDSEGYVSDKSLSDSPVATNASTAQSGNSTTATAVSTEQVQANTGKTKTTSTASASTQYDSIEDAAIAKFGPNAVVFADGAIFDSSTWQQLGTVNDLDGVDLNNSTIKAKANDIITLAEGYNREVAEQVWSLVNAERTAAGLNALTWDEDMYNYACARTQEIMTDFSHNGCFSGYGENIHWSPYTEDANGIHQAWYNSPGHHANYMSDRYGSGACAVYVYNGMIYAVENFAPATNLYATNQYRESNGETLDLTGQQAEAFDNGNTWTASNGVVVYIQSDGNLSCNESDMDRAMAAFNEYDATH